MLVILTVLLIYSLFNLIGLQKSFLIGNKNGRYSDGAVGTMEELTSFYFSLEIQYIEIISYLALTDDIFVSDRHQTKNEEDEFMQKKK